ncbi:MAG: biotin/lipoyl-binding protein [Acidobacteria bacterium]|nr:biotin/lipoyl-binding protein [Acidobacteriota bacterium]
MLKLEAHLPDGKSHTVEVQVQDEKAEILLDGRPLSVWFRKLNESRCVIDLQGQMVDVVVHRSGRRHTVILGGRTYRMELFDQRFGRAAEEDAGEGIQSVRAEMPGRVVRLLKGVGEQVRKNEGILVLEAMKMQNEVRSPRAGLISQVAVQEGESVPAGQLLFEVR